MDQQTRQAATLFLQRLSARRPFSVAWLFGSRARVTQGLEKDIAQSDADIAIVLAGTPQGRVDLAVEMAALAFDVMLETGVLIDPLPLWEDEWRHPEVFANPRLLANIRQDGLRL
ncbi:hypothetical protein Thiowin_03384 [Thiorhodovibrio winogradskyi]|uniref:DNA polymerase III subunit beta n=1 Tax=Thiorhodovibrio winogradskyi TaxID=77007 RepID=A0ABZ0SDC2_9GAMM|nr:nucleotidyltransferase domain-containing protein [Thiorhodovibrio winogradskyi]